MSYSLTNRLDARQRRKGRAYDPALDSTYPPFDISTNVFPLSAERVVSSVRSAGFPKVKPENPYSVYIRRYGDAGPIQNLREGFQYPYVIELAQASSFSAVNPTSTFLSYLPNPPAISESELNGRLRRRVLDSKVNLSVLLAESKQTVSMVLQTANTLARAYRHVRRGNLVAAADTLKVRPIKDTGKGPAGNWLAYNYGWVPMLSDVRGSAEHLARRVLATPFQQRVTVSMGQKSRHTESGLSVNGSVGFPHTLYAKYDAELEVSAKATVVYETRNDALREMSQLGFTNPALVAWELVPLSFVVDWFLPIGNYLEQFNAFQGLTIKKGFINHRTNRSLRGIIQLNGTGQWTESDFSFSRKVNQSFGVQFPVPSIPNHNVVSKILTSLALFRQRV